MTMTQLEIHCRVWNCEALIDGDNMVAWLYDRLTGLFLEIVALK